MSLFACRGNDEGFGRDAVPVLAAKVVKQSVADQIHEIGTVTPYTTVSVKARVPGQVDVVHFKEGEDVTRGELLFTIDPRPYESELRKAQADLARDLAKARQAEADLKRWTKLWKEGVASKAQDDQAVTEARAADSLADADRAAAENAKLNLEYSSIRSPIDGRTGAVKVHPGNLVKSDDSTPLVVINQLRPIYVEFTVPEQNLARIREAMAAGRLAVDAQILNSNGSPAHGQLSFIDNAVDRATGTIRLKGSFANDDDRLWPGQFANVTLTLGERPDMVVVPAQAIQTGQEGQYVFVVGPKMVAEQRHVVAGDSMDGKTVVIEGLRPGETVVTDGQLRVTPGGKVKIKSGLEASGTG